mmetsp:Transcript_85639/g.165939  ORF Transcript_85639/g.165939 Transcript_85639/m.165939 type:complete len:84 (+) Transcript_85639:396-647(+)
MWGADVEDKVKKSSKDEDGGARVVGYDPNAVFGDLDSGGCGWDEDGDGGSGGSVLEFAESLGVSSNSDDAPMRSRARTKSTGI